MSEYAESEFKIIRSVIICKNSGEFLVDLRLDSDIDPVMISSFVSALSMFGGENLGKIEEISVKGLSIEMVVVSKHDLVLIAMMDRDFFKDIVRKTGERILDLFYGMFETQLDDVVELGKFELFRDVLLSEVQLGLDRMKELEEKRGILKAGLEYKE
jgi:hypothetical protein